ncbi:hypothetical protein F5148DRAFT_1157337 [Russula earlei]|uniref:Uncharacterized protein n=1 Tax=Russula earlei TaxID=71964 RepID=A0ACC0UNL0_9AGAM|nr:hypothetical protein F5148DRAFT_1157337 [Russula earlei]
MLGPRTKQVFSYGRRNRRVINDKHDLFDAEDTKKSSGAIKENEPASTVLVTPLSGLRRRENDQAYPSSLKRCLSPTSIRQPLSSNSLNVSRRSPPSGPKKKARHSGRKGAQPPRSPDVDLDIFVLDETGRRVSQERRVSKPNVRVNQRTVLNTRPERNRNSIATSAIVGSDCDDDDDSSPEIKQHSKRWPKVMSSSDEEDVAGTPIRSTACLASPRPDDLAKTLVVTDFTKPLVAHSSRPNFITSPRSHFWVEIPTPRLPPLSRGYSQTLTLYDSPPKPSKRRPLTPMRRKGLSFSQLSPSPSTITDISLDLADLTLSSTSLESYTLPVQPPHLIHLLDECGQNAPVEFSAFIEAFPVHPVVRSSYPGHAVFQKIGEASYSEVFGIGDVVIKIIPIRNEEYPDKLELETPAPSDAKDVLNEIVVTRALGEMCNGFVNLLKTYVVRGRYPSLLLDLWDEYNRTKGSESVRPDMLTVSQVYAIIVLPNGGPDLEAYSFSEPSKTAWRQACSIFWQVSRALATAENLVSFEHRDLHWGQILVKNVPSSVSTRRRIPTADVWLPMDHLVHGVKVTVIDLGLARMNALADDGSTEVRWTPFDEEIFEGEGDYQFDIYRLMREHNGGRWANFCPLSNVMWLYYLLVKLLKSKNLRPPRKTNTSTGPGFTEWQCYDCLVRMETLLAQSVQQVQACKPVVIKAGRRKIATSTNTANVTTSAPSCAGDVVKFGETMGWV